MNIRPEPILWTEDLATGIAEIDQQHRILVNMLNIANEKLVRDISRNALLAIVHDLMSYAVYHFDTEEELMIENQFPASAQDPHVQEHRQFSSKIAELHRQISQGELISCQELLDFLNDWLLNHITKNDKKLGSFLSNRLTR